MIATLPDYGTNPRRYSAYDRLAGDSVDREVEDGAFWNGRISFVSVSARCAEDLFVNYFVTLSRNSAFASGQHATLDLSRRSS